MSVFGGSTFSKFKQNAHHFKEVFGAEIDDCIKLFDYRLARLFDEPNAGLNPNIKNSMDYLMDGPEKYNLEFRQWRIFNQMKTYYETLKIRLLKELNTIEETFLKTIQSVLSQIDLEASVSSSELGTNDDSSSDFRHSSLGPSRKQKSRREPCPECYDTRHPSSPKDIGRRKSTPKKTCMEYNDDTRHPGLSMQTGRRKSKRKELCTEYDVESTPEMSKRTKRSRTNSVVLGCKEYQHLKLPKPIPGMYNAPMNSKTSFDVEDSNNYSLPAENSSAQGMYNSPVKSKISFDEEDYDDGSPPTDTSKAQAAQESNVQFNEANWKSFSSVTSDSLPTCPGVYEVKVIQAKKTAFIGHCDNLRKIILLHKEGSTNEKHVDKFIQRNIENILIKYETLPSLQLAVKEKKTRLRLFLENYKTLPAFNYFI